MGKLQGSWIGGKIPGNRNRGLGARLAPSGPANLALGGIESQRTQAPPRGNDVVN